jgi:RNA polymerase sigma-70 factor (ECF subfamily)
VALTALDRDLLKRCLQKEPGAWNDFVDRFLGLIYHIIHHTAHLRSTPLRPEDTEDLAAEILLQIVANDYAVLRQFRGHSGLATYLTVISRRICVQALAQRAAAREVQPKFDGQRPSEPEPEGPDRPEAGLETLEEVARLLRKLPSRERSIVRLHYLEGRTYEEIATQLNIPVNSIGPILSRARKKLRAGVKSPPPVHRASARAQTKPKSEKQAKKAAEPQREAPREPQPAPQPEARTDPPPETRPEQPPESLPAPQPEPRPEGESERREG